MRPVDHLKPSEDEIIAHIKDSLTAYEEDYAPGAWEKFQAKEESKPVLVLWIGRLSSAAAVVLLGMALFWFTKSTPTHTHGHVKAVIAPEIVQLEPQVEKKGVDAVVKVNKVTQSYRGAKGDQINIATTEQPIENYHEFSITSTQVPEENGLQPSALNTPPAIAATGINEEIKQSKEANRTTLEEFLKAESANGKTEKMAKSVVKENKWEMGVVVAPSLGNAGKLNMGYGLSMGYALSDKVSLNSGVSYNEMAATKSVATNSYSAPSSSALVGESKSLESVEQRVIGIDIPLDVKYNLSKSLYANIGVSAFAVIDQQRSNNYIQERLVESPAASLTGGYEFKTLIVSEKVTESAPESEVQNKNYIGFHNFSFGYKQKVGKEKFIAIEPFMKVPMKEASKDNLRLMGTGLKLRFDF